MFSTFIAWLKSLFDSKPRLVAICSTPCHMTTEGVRRDGNFFYHLYETKNGVRSVVYSCSLINCPNPIQNAKNYDHKKVVDSWLNGAFYPNIPSYSEMTDIEFAARMSGKPSIEVMDIS